MPSDSETLGFVVIEAMASGLPVVAANAGGIPSIVDHDKNGLLCPPGDTTVFADTVSKVLDDDGLRDRLKTRARKDAEGWGWKAATKHLRNVHYTAAIRRHAALKRARARGDFLSVLFSPPRARFIKMKIQKFFAAVFNQRHDEPCFDVTSHLGRSHESQITLRVERNAVAARDPLEER